MDHVSSQILDGQTGITLTSTPELRYTGIMVEWIMAHPWMTFFVAMALANGISISIGQRRRNRE